MAINNTLPAPNYGGLFAPKDNSFGGIFNGPKTSLAGLISPTPLSSKTAPSVTPAVKVPVSVKPPVSVTPPTPTPPPATQPVKGLLPPDTSALRGQLQNLQSQVTAATAAGYGPNDTIQRDANGNVVPKTQVPTFGGLAATIPQTALTPSATQQSTLQGAQDYINKLEQSRANEAAGLANIAEEPIPLEFQQGRQQVIQSQYQQQQDALAQAAAAQAGLYGTATTAQGQTLGALEGVAGLVKPSVTGFGQTTFNPVTNSFGTSGGTNLDPQTQATTLAQQVMSGKLTYDQALSSLGYAGSVGSTFLNNAITAAGGNPLQLQSSGAGSQAVLQTLPQMNAANTAAKGIQNQITTFLQQNPNLNPSQFSDVNSVLQLIQGKTSSPAQQTLSNYLNEYISTLAPVLGIGGDTTNLKTEIAQSMINAKASGQSITDVLNNISALADQKVANLQSGATGGGVVGGSSSGGAGSAPLVIKAADGNQYSFHQDASGKWVPN